MFTRPKCRSALTEPDKKRPSLIEISVIAAVAAIGLFSFFLSARAAVLNWNAVPFWDMWDGYINFYFESKSDFWGAMWSQHNEHRIVITKLFFLSDFAFFKGSGESLLFLNIAFSALISIGLIFLLKKRLVEEFQTLKPNLFFAILASTLAIISSSWVQNENFWWGFQSQFWLNSLLPIVVFLLIGISRDRMIRGENYGIQIAIAGFLLIIVGTNLAAGFLAAFVASALIVALRFGRKLIVGSFVFAIGISIIYFFNWKPSPTEPQPISIDFDEFANIARYLLRYFGAPVQELTGGGLSASLIGLLFVFTVLFSVVRNIRKAELKIYFLVALANLLFAFLLGLITAFGRSGLGIEQASASRYQTPVVIAWASLLVILAPEIRRLFAYSKGIVLFSFAIVIIVFLPYQLRADDGFTRMQDNRNLATLAIALRIPDSDAITNVYPNYVIPLQMIDEVEKADISIFRLDGLSSLDDRLGSVEPSTPAECTATVQSKEEISNSNFIRITGLLSFSVAGSQSRPTPILNSSSVVIGYAIRQISNHEFNETGETSTGFVGYVVRESEIFGVGNSDGSLCIATGSRAIK